MQDVFSALNKGAREKRRWILPTWRLILAPVSNVPTHSLKSSLRMFRRLVFFFKELRPLARADYSSSEFVALMYGVMHVCFFSSH